MFRCWELALCLFMRNYKDHHTCTLYRDYVNDQEEMREVLDQLFQVNFITSLLIWIVRLLLHIQ